MGFGIKVSMVVRVIDENDPSEIYLDPECFECNVQPPPHCYGRPQVLDTMSDALAKVVFINRLYSRLADDQELAKRLKGKKWKIDAYVRHRERLPPYTCFR
jgi:hypothetical protein